MEKIKIEKIATYMAGFGEGKYRVEAVAVTCGKDVAVIAGGGTDYHIGAAVLAVPRPSLADPSRLSASSSVICVTGHKDDEIAKRAAQSLASYLGCIVTVSAGIHVDNASSEDISIIEQYFNIVLEQIKIQLQRHYGNNKSI